MKKAILVSLHFIGRVISWRWLTMIAGVALITACSGKADKTKVGTDTSKDTERVTCYEPVSIDTAKSQIQSKNEVTPESAVVSDTSDYIPIIKCYVPVHPLEGNE